MVVYNLNHLTQNSDQKVGGPIQDDEALFLYSIVKGMRLSRIVEVGGLNGYSSQNFIRALDNVEGILYTIDINPVPVQSNNHKVITKNAKDISKEDLDNQSVDLIFFDCHDMIQMSVYYNLVESNIITDSTLIALHDTNLHYPPYHSCGTYLKDEDAYAHQPVERIMVNNFKDLGYDMFMLHTTRDKHSDSFPYRHGITICQKFKTLIV